MIRADGGRRRARRRPHGGQIATALGTDAPNVVGLVYIAAFGLDEGESLGALLSQGPVTPALVHTFTDERGFVWLSEEDFVGHFAADVDRQRARVLWAVQQALAGSAFADVMGVPAWKSLPTWYLVAKDDEAIPPDAERPFAARMGATTSRSRPATSRWSLIRTMSRASSNEPRSRSGWQPSADARSHAIAAFGCDEPGATEPRKDDSRCR